MSNFGALGGTRVSIRTGIHLLRLFWPDFVEVNGCIFAAFQLRGGPIQQLKDGKTETECFINHTHLLDEFRNRATSERRDAVSRDFEVVEGAYDVNHPDFVGACELGKQIARMWADRKSTRLNSSHLVISYAVFCLKKKQQLLPGAIKPQLGEIVLYLQLADQHLILVAPPSALPPTSTLVRHHRPTLYPVPTAGLTA